MINRIRNKIARVLKNLLFSDLNERISRLEYRSFNRRFYAIEQCAEYLVGAQIDGDYLEFGVYKGDTFTHAYSWMSPHFKTMRFFALDSFEGLPKPEGIDLIDGYSSHFYEGQYAYSEEDFVKNLESKNIDLNKVITVKGWFDKTLTAATFKKYNLNKVSVAWIDCDLYESTVPVLEFLTPLLSVGSVIIFDDWRCYRNHPDFGEQRACAEWLEKNPRIKLAELYSFGWNGIAFSVISI
jgi:hypothetical protein